MSKLLDYLNHLDQNADARAAHVSDPAKAMSDFGLNEDEQKALASGDKSVVAKASGIDEGELPTIEITESLY
jgi:hypothetical protein